MMWKCTECESELIHYNGSSNWVCPNKKCLVSYETLKRVKKGKVFTYEVDRVVYATVL